MSSYGIVRESHSKTHQLTTFPITANLKAPKKNPTQSILNHEKPRLKRGNMENIYENIISFTLTETMHFFFCTEDRMRSFCTANSKAFRPGAGSHNPPRCQNDRALVAPRKSHDKFHWKHIEHMTIELNEWKHNELFSHISNKPSLAIATLNITKYLRSISYWPNTQSAMRTQNYTPSLHLFWLRAPFLSQVDLYCPCSKGHLPCLHSTCCDFSRLSLRPQRFGTPSHWHHTARRHTWLTSGPMINSC